MGENSQIFNFFSLINIGERSGTGLCDLFNIWNEEGFDTPIINESFEPPRITLTMQIESFSPENDSNQAKNDSNPLTQIEQMVLSVLHVEPTVSATKIAKKISVSVATVNRALQSLKIKGFIEREGGTRGRWINKKPTISGK